MKKRLLSILLFFICLFTGCFEDNGNYNYVEMNPPKWLFDTYFTNINIYARIGEVTTFRASDQFIWDGEDRSKDVRYEWILNGVVLSEELDFEIPTEELLQKGGIKQLTSAVFGSFNIIEKKTGINYMCRVCIFLNPKYATADWVILSEDNGNSKCSVLRRSSKIENGETKEYYELIDNCYEQVNGSKIPGKPIRLCMAKARHVGPLGSSTVITDQGAYEIDNATMEKYEELKDQFLDGTPADFVVNDRRERDPADASQPVSSFIATKKGEIFTRQMSKNFLGGQFLTEPYYLDKKGYKITKFSHNLYSANIACYDELNRRIVMACVARVDIHTGDQPQDVKYVYKTKLIASNPVDGGGVPYWEMPEGTKVLHISQNQNTSWMPAYSSAYTIYYNDENGNTYMGDFIFNNVTLRNTAHYFTQARWHRFPQNLTEESVILKGTCARANVPNVYRDFYSVDNEIRYVQRSNAYYDFAIADYPLLKVDSKVTSMTFEWYRTNEKILVVGCENGDLIGYDLSNMAQIKEIFKVNVGGKVVAAKELGEANSYQDYF